MSDIITAHPPGAATAPEMSGPLGGDGVRREALSAEAFETPRFSLASENPPLPTDAGEPAPLREQGSKEAKPSRLEQAIGKDAVAFFEEAQAAIKAEAVAVVSLGRQGDDALYAFLERSHAFVKDERFTEDKFVTFCRARKLSCTKATRRNLFLCAIRAIAPEIDAKMASKYAKALQWVEAKLPEGTSAAEFIKAEKGIEACAKKARKSERPESGARETEGGRRLAINGVPKGLTGIVSLVVEIIDGRTKLLSHAQLESEEILHPGAEIPRGPAAPRELADPVSDVATGDEHASDEAKEVERQN